jgi:hypothetical protein
MSSTEEPRKLTWTTCASCKNMWDGNAQCNCSGSDDDIDEVGLLSNWTTCASCKNMWDGNAQCNCGGFDDDMDELAPDEVGMASKQAPSVATTEAPPLSVGNVGALARNICNNKRSAGEMLGCASYEARATTKVRVV